MRSALPIEGITFILGNGVAGGRVWADGPLPPPVVSSVLLVRKRPDESEVNFPEVFTACAVTRAMACADASHDGELLKDVKHEASELVAFSMSDVPLSVSLEDLQVEQRADPSGPLFPVPAASQSFEHLIIDCVSSLPPSSSGAVYLLTVMCQTTRYPAAYPLHMITARSVARPLSQFILVFGIQKIIQSDQGSNFSSHLLSQILKQLHVKHNKVYAYHVQSQGALERFHQTLKSLLRVYCTEMERDWEEGLPWLLLAALEVTQESTGFSPND